MIGHDNVLCLCPAGRFFLVSLTLSTWTNVERYVLSEDDSRDLSGFSAVIVMDRFVAKSIVDRLAKQLPVIVLAWNGLFEIERYRTELGAEVTYMGTDELPSAELVAAGVRYMPMINGRCVFVEWQARYHDGRQFVVEGNAAYKLRWLRSRLYANRAFCVALSAGAAAIKRPRSVVSILKSAFLSEKLAWAGNCYYEPSSFGLTPTEVQALDASITSMRRASTADDQLEAGLDLVRRWRELGRTHTHEGIYVTNTLLRWTVLGFMLSAFEPATWFFGSDNVGLGLSYELDVYSLVSNRRVAFVDFGGKTSETTLYPRSLQLLVRSCYVIAISALESDHDSLAATVERIQTHVEQRPHEFFDSIEKRRRSLYENLPANCELHEVQRRVWSDFASYSG